MRFVLFTSLALALPGLSACGSSDDASGVGGVTASEARALNDAAEMLDSRPGAPADLPAEASAP